VIPDDVVDRVRNEADAVAIIGEFVKLKRVGNSFRGPCPFHHGKNPNFSVNERGYNCFKCGESGDVFTFAQKQLGLDFVEAARSRARTPIGLALAIRRATALSCGRRSSRSASTVRANCRPASS
jgi:DNA primase